MMSSGNGESGDGDGSVIYDLVITPSTSKKQNIKRRRKKSKDSADEDEIYPSKTPKESPADSECSPDLRRSKRLSHPVLIEDLDVNVFATPPPTDIKKRKGRDDQENPWTEITNL